MAEKATSGAAGRAPAAGQPENVRNVVLVGHSGAGKTTLAEALLGATNTIQRIGRVEDGSTVSDFDEVEIRQQRSVNLTVAPFVHNEVKVNLLDTPGYADFIGDLRAGLRAADAALFAISAADGIDGLTSILWDECASAGTPRAVVITKLDHHRGDFNEALDACRAAFGESVAPLYLPVGDGQGTVNGLIGLLSERYYEYSDGKRTERDPDPADTDRMEEYRGALIAEVVKTTSDPYVGRISLVRVFSGTLRPDATVHVSGHGRADRGHADHDEDERIGALTSPLGKQQRSIASCAAGDICAVAKLTSAETGDTLSDKERPLLMESWAMPEPLLPIAISAKSKADEDKMSQALSRLVAEDSTLRLENNAETHQLVLWCMGEAHADLLLDRLSSRYGVAVETVGLRVPLRETVGGRSNGLGRNVKQSGGHGEYAICHIEVEPLPSGGGFEFVDKIVGGVVPRQFIPSVEKGVRTQMEQGVVAGYPMVDLRVTLYDGKAHSVDSSDMAFQKAGRAALRDATERAQPQLLEPVDEVSVLIGDDYVGAVMSDLSSRRGRVLGTEPVAGGRTLVKAEIPELELIRYATDLRSLSHGTGSFSRSYLRYEPLPSHLREKVTTEADQS